MLFESLLKSREVCPDDDKIRMILFALIDLLYTLSRVFRGEGKSATQVFSATHAFFSQSGKTGNVRFGFKSGASFTAQLVDYSPCRIKTYVYGKSVDCNASHSSVRRGGGRYKTHFAETDQAGYEALYTLAYILLGIQSGMPSSLDTITRGIVLQYLWDRLKSVMGIVSMEYTYGELVVDLVPIVDMSSGYLDYINSKLENEVWRIVKPNSIKSLASVDTSGRDEDLEEVW